jgi:Secretion system C-terminal sorting domain/Outer membrane protein Omp28
MKLFVSLLLVLFGLNMSLNAQIFVNQSPANKVVVLEEFTGIHCGYCPQGHVIAQGILDANSGNVVLINIHAGGYAVPSAGEPDFRTPFGTAIAGQSGLYGYPAGTVNRHYFGHSQTGSAAGSTALSRTQWTADANTILAQSSYVNVAIQASVDSITRIATIHVQAYYTGASSQSTNFLNLVMLQDKTYGPQSGGVTPYEHNHRLVDMITGQWGDTIFNTTSGSLYDSVFTYTIPADHNSIPIELGNIQFAAFVTETKQEIISGYGQYPAYTNLTYTKDLAVKDISMDDITCDGIVPISVEFKNRGEDTITSFNIAYNINGETDSTYQWTGQILSLGTTTIELPEYTINTVTATNEAKIVISNVNGTGADQVASNDTITGNINEAKTAHPEITIEVKTDGYASETKWYLRNSAGSVVAFKTSGFSNNTVHTDVVTLTSSECYEFQITDSYGDGIAPGYYKITDGDGQVVIYQSSFSGSEEYAPFEVDTYLEVEENNIAEMQIFPNPTSDNINVTFFLSETENVTTVLYDQQGRMISSINHGSFNGNNTINIDTEGLSSGIYFIRLIAGEQQESQKFSVVK